MLGLFVCKKRLETENAQWITGNYAAQSASLYGRKYAGAVKEQACKKTAELLHQA